MVDDRSVAELQRLKDLFHRGLIDEHEYRTHKNEILQRFHGGGGGAGGAGAADVNNKLIVGGMINGRFQLVQRLGQGGFGEVWKALDKDLGRDVAIKVQIDAAKDKVATERFLREMRIAAQLRHQNIVTVYDMGRTENGSLFVVTEFIKGISLHDYLCQKQIREAEVAKIAIDCLSALEEAHKTRLVHRDIKPGNIMLEEMGRDCPYVVKLIDFGLAKRGGGDTVSMTHAISGTLPFMSPEQLRGFEPDPRMDLWSIGVSMFQALTGKLPFDHPDNAALMQKIFNQPTPDVRIYCRGVSPGMVSIINKSLEKNPALRFQSARDFKRALERLVASGGNATVAQQQQQQQQQGGGGGNTMFGKLTKFADEIGRGLPNNNLINLNNNNNNNNNNGALQPMPPQPPKPLQPQMAVQEISAEPGLGSVRPFGDDGMGQLGGGHARCSIRSIVDAAMVAAGGNHSLVLLADGHVRAFGSDEFKQLGGGSASENVPGLSEVVSIAAGGFHSLALIYDGTVRAWGHNGCGQCGAEGGTISVPRQMTNIFNVVAVAAGRMHTLILLSDGTLRAFGDDSYGQIGEGSLTTPCAGISGAISVAAGAYHSLALIGDGTIRAFGRCMEGQLGKEGVGWDEEWSPMMVVPSIRNAIAVAAGAYHSLALLSDGSVRGWGDNQFGQTGNASTVISVPGISDCVAIAAGGNHSLAALANGTVRAFGQNAKGQLGGGSGVSTCTGVAAGTNHSLLLLSGKKLIKGLNIGGIKEASPVPIAKASPPQVLHNNNNNNNRPSSALNDLLGAANRVAAGRPLDLRNPVIVGEYSPQMFPASAKAPPPQQQVQGLPVVGSVFVRPVERDEGGVEGEMRTLMLC